MRTSILGIVYQFIKYVTAFIILLIYFINLLLSSFRISENLIEKLPVHKAGQKILKYHVHTPNDENRH
ncbi:hypothetical protein [Flavobacterium phage FPSV-S29]|nr:hypothetical protein [Flavobacterium phage FPSV-F12]QCW20741.1 hypothetical protein [Flavobacterium phage FPSV-S29]